MKIGIILAFIFSIFFIPSIYLFLNYTNSEELSCGIIALIGTILLLFIEFNKDKPSVVEFIRKYI